EVMARIAPKRIVRKAPRKKKPVRLDNDERRAQLLAMGPQAAATYSYDEVSTDDLAKKSKLSKGLFYYYFPTKRDLYIAGLRETAQEPAKKLVDLLFDMLLRFLDPRDAAKYKQAR